MGVGCAGPPVGQFKHLCCERGRERHVTILTVALAHELIASTPRLTREQLEAKGYVFKTKAS